jgi:transcriptional regulator GlxA family with amidase domain
LDGRVACADLAPRVGTSRSAFPARFAQLVEEPPLTYLTRWRMQEASRLLETSQARVAEIARRVGYEAAFSKAFERRIGVAPGAYRRTAESRAKPKRPVAGDAA